jgi:hypothetical protein
MTWQEVSGNWVLLPSRPVALIHFLGGAFVATAPQATYRRLLECLSRHGYGIIATPFINTLDHTVIAQEVQQSFERTLKLLHSSLRLRRFLPIYGLGHSMGCKLHLLIGSLFSVQRAGNILISFNNYSARRAIPLVESLTFVTSLEFSPTPEETNRLIQEHYQVRRNLLVHFTQDDIDQTPLLRALLQKRFPEMIAVQKLAGNHLTPLGPDINWQAGTTFTPLDALGQWMRQEIYRDLYQLEQAILLWLDPLANLPS